MLGGDRKWLSVFLMMFVWRKAKSLFGFGDPQPVFIAEAEPGQLMVVAHEDDSTSRRKRRKQAKKDAKVAEKQAAKRARKVEKTAAKTAKKAAKV